MSEVQSRIQDLITKFVAEVRDVALAEARAALAAALGGDVSSTPINGNRAPKVAKAPKEPKADRTKGEKRSKDDLADLRAKLVEFITANPGLRIELINKQMGLNAGDAFLPLKRLLKEGAISTQGARRTTTYWPGAGAAPKAKKAKAKKAKESKPKKASKKKSAPKEAALVSGEGETPEAAAPSFDEIKKAIETAGGSVRGAAKELGIAESTLRRRVAKGE